MTWADLKASAEAAGARPDSPVSIRHDLETPPRPGLAPRIEVYTVPPEAYGYPPRLVVWVTTAAKG